MFDGPVLRRRLMRHVYISEDCWTWRQPIKGVPRLWIGDKEILATWASYYIVHRRWPETSGCQRLTRLCGNKICVRPRHLDIVSASTVQQQLRREREGCASWIERCQSCQQPFRVRPRHWRRGWARYCSRPCALASYQR
jgi:hypothetical protein